MRFGVIDIGYNAIRAAVYENRQLGSPEIFNNKFKNDILSLLERDDLDIKHQTYLSLQYIVDIFARLNVKDIFAVATAVLRDHPRAKDFTDYVYDKFAVRIEIITGEREAYLTGCGLISGINHANGIIADLGGGSLELAEVNERRVGKIVSLNIAVNSLDGSSINSYQDVVAVLCKYYPDNKYENLYLIGGSLRFLSRVYLDYVNYPIKNLHNLEIRSQEFSNYLENSKTQEFVKSKKIRRFLNKDAILIAQGLVELFLPEKVVVSNYGLKEGLRFENVAEEHRNVDIVLEKSIYYMKYDYNMTDFEQYFRLIEKIMDCVIDEKKVRDIVTLSIIFLSSFKYFDHTLPPKSMIEYILSTEIPFTHNQRIILALVISYYSNFEPDLELIKISKRLLTKNEYNIAQIVAHFLRIATDVDGALYISPSFGITLTGHYLEIETKKMLPRPIFEKVCERLKLISFVKRSLHSLYQKPS